MSEPRDPVAPEGVLDGINLRSVVLGVVVDHVASFVFGTALLMVLATDDIGSSDDAVAQAALEAVITSPEFALSALIGGSICTVLAAFVGARHAGARHLRHGAWIAAGSAALALAFYPASEAITWLDWVGWALIVPAGLFGGALAQWADLAESRSPEEDEWS